MAISASLSFLVPAYPDPVPSPYAAVSAGPSLSAEPGFAALPSAAGNAGLGVDLGPAFIEIGAAYMSPSAYGEDWYRYRGYMAAYAEGGYRFAVGGLSGFVGAGLALAKYSLSESYFAFPFVEPGLTLLTIPIGRALALSMRVSAPLRLRPDAFSGGLELSSELSWLPGPKTREKPRE